MTGFSVKKQGKRDRKKIGAYGWFCIALCGRLALDIYGSWRAKRKRRLYKDA